MVCVDYSDYLNYFLKYNLKHFDKLVIVTTEEDSKTIKICKRYKTKYIITNRLKERGATFNKGKAINDGLKHISMKDWVLLIDADMILENDFRKTIETKYLKKDFLYGILRYNCPNYDIWQKYSLLNYKEQKKFLCDIVERWRRRCNRRKRISGYFQLFNAKKFDFRKDVYPEKWGRANRSDKIFVMNWVDNKREYLTDMFALHFDHGGKMGVNWDGRKSPEFKKDNSIMNHGKKDL